MFHLSACRLRHCSLWFMVDSFRGPMITVTMMMVVVVVMQWMDSVYYPCINNLGKWKVQMCCTSKIHHLLGPIFVIDVSFSKKYPFCNKTRYPFCNKKNTDPFCSKNRYTFCNKTR